MLDASEDTAVSLLKDWVGNERTITWAAYDSNTLWQLLANFPRPKPGNPLLEQFFEGSALKPFHPLANQIDFDPRENIFHHILSLWSA
jgi:hypothetical protein